MGTVKKNEVINLRVSAEQKEAIQRDAVKMGMGISKYLLYLAEHKQIVTIDGGRELAAEVYRLNQALNRFEKYPFVSVQELRNAVSQGIADINCRVKGGI